MKKYLLLLVAMMSSVYCMAGGIKVKEGKSAFLKEDASAIVEFDFSKTTWEGKEDFKTWCGNQYEKRVDAIQQSFKKSFNENTKGLKIVEDAKDAKYKIIVKVEDLERHQSFTGAWGQGKFSTTATISVIELATNQSVCEIIVDGYGSGKDFDYADGLGKCYKGLAKDIVKMK